MSASLFRKKGVGKRDVRSRDSNVVTDDKDVRGDEQGSSVVTKKRKVTGAGNPLRQGTFSSRREKDSAETGDDPDSFDALGYGSTPNDKGGLDHLNDATRMSNWFDQDSAQTSEADKKKASNDDGLYRGAASYSKYTTERDDGMSSKLKAATKGPVKASSNVRTVTTVDYQPDVCKDYKETGYCGFGDTCKFLHDRSDYLAGWQLDSVANGGRRREDILEIEDVKEEEDIPFACLICRKPFVDPVVTKCGHFFCSSCAIKRYSKTSKCFACGAQTQGIFNSAQKILDRKEKIRALKQEEREEKRWDKDEDVEAQDSKELLEGVEVGNGEDTDV